MKIKHIETLLDQTQLLVEYENGFEEIFETKDAKSNCSGCYFIADASYHGYTSCGHGMACCPYLGRTDNKHVIWVKI